MGWDESVGLIIEAGGRSGVGLLYERDSPWVSRVWYICISESSFVQSCTSTLAKLLRYFLVMIPTLRIRIHVVLLLIFITKIITFLDTILLTDAANCRSAEVHV